MIGSKGTAFCQTRQLGKSSCKCRRCFQFDRLSMDRDHSSQCSLEEKRCKKANKHASIPPTPMREEEQIGTIEDLCKYLLFLLDMLQQ